MSIKNDYNTTYQLLSNSLKIYNNDFLHYNKKSMIIIIINITDPKRMQSTKNFKIRKTGLKPRTIQQYQDQELVANLQDLRLDQNHYIQENNTQKQEIKSITVAVYNNDEENVNCIRFPHQYFCGCQSNCLLENFQAIQVIPKVYFGNFTSGLKSKYLLDIGITHILNVTCKQYMKRKQYFKYCQIDVKSNTEEDVKKYFRFANRFIKDAVDAGGKVFVHCSVIQIAAIMVSAYMIGILKISLKQCLQKMANKNIEIGSHFIKQLQAYDLQKMAFVSIQKQ